MKTGIPLLFEALLRSGAIRTGRVDIARRDADGATLGVAVWESPRHVSRIRDQLAELPAFVRALGVGGVARAIRLQHTLAAHHPSEPHWYLSQIAVAPVAQGAGVGSALLDHGLSRADGERIPAYLESSNARNRRLYERHGFQTMTIIDGIRGAQPAAMWHPSPSRV